MKNLIRLILYICIALVPISCGTRKTATKILKNAEIVESKSSSKGEVKKVDEKKEATKELAKESNIDEAKTITVVELFNDSGVIKSRVIETKIDRKSKKKYDAKDVFIDAIISVDSVFNNNQEAKKEVTLYEKEKSVTSDRNGLYWSLGIAVVIGLLFLFKPWK